MKIIIILICVSLSIAVGFLFLFLWSVRSGQFDDVHTPAVRMLFDDKKKTDASSADDFKTTGDRGSGLSSNRDASESAAGKS
jgi:cbb3-type cytochrome oxidase maturation protein